MPRITPNLWFDTAGLEAAEFYISIFPNSGITNLSYYGDSVPDRAGTVLTVDYTLDGQRFTNLNGGPEFTFDEAVSLGVNCADQDEVDHYWNALLEGGEESQCGWLKDRYGFSWQIIPDGLDQALADPDPARADRAMKAMLGMRKLDIAAIRAAADRTD